MCWPSKSLAGHDEKENGWQGKMLWRFLKPWIDTSMKDVMRGKLTKSSGGPSSASSADCSSPILERSQTCRRRSVPEEARIVSLWGDHCTWKISSLCDSKLWSLSLRLRRSQSATVLSALPVARMNSLYGLKLRQLTFKIMITSERN